jgi:hypothetical protein
MPTACADSGERKAKVANQKSPIERPPIHNPDPQTHARSSSSHPMRDYRLYPNAGFANKNHIQIYVREIRCIKGYFWPPNEAEKRMRFG